MYRVVAAEVRTRLSMGREPREGVRLFRLLPLVVEFVACICRDKAGASVTGGPSDAIETWSEITSGVSWRMDAFAVLPRRIGGALAGGELVVGM